MRWRPRAGGAGSAVTVNWRTFSSPVLFSLPSSFGVCAADVRLLISVNQLEITDAGQRQPICLIKSQRSLFLLRSEFSPGQAPCYSNLHLILPLSPASELSHTPFAGRSPPPAAGLAGLRGIRSSGPLDRNPKIVLLSSVCHPAVHVQDNFSLKTALSSFSFFLSCTPFRLFSSRQ